jgi:hypothetical protein
MTNKDPFTDNSRMPQVDRERARSRFADSWFATRIIARVRENHSLWVSVHLAVWARARGAARGGKCYGPASVTTGPPRRRPLWKAEMEIAGRPRWRENGRGLQILLNADMHTCSDMSSDLVPL